METKDPDTGGPPTDPTDGAELRPLRWPPPGLARLQGDAYSAAVFLGASAILIIPLLWAMVGVSDPWSLGPLGESLWVAFVLALVGLSLMAGGYVAFIRLLRRASDAVGQGHHWRVVALVAADRRRDTGFLLQGARFYEVMPDGERRWVATVRIVLAALVIFATLWITLGFGIGVVLAARGVLGPWGVVVFTLGPSALAAVVAVLGYAWEEGRLRKCRKKWFSRTWSQELERDEIHAWHRALSERAPGIPAPAEDGEEGGGRARTVLRVLYGGLSVAAIAAFVPIVTLSLSAAIIPTLARISVPEYDDMVARAAALEPLRSYVLPRDTTIDARDAAEMLHSLSFVGQPYRATEGVLPPERALEEPWFPVGDRRSPPSAWMEDRLDSLGLPLPPSDREFLRPVAAHPAHELIAELGRASELDIAGVRWSLPLPSGVTMNQLSTPHLGAIREGAYAHLGKAALEASQGRAARADTTIREILNVGFLMADESPIVLDNLVGVAVVRIAGSALESLYRNTGQGDGAALAWAMASVDRSIERAQAATLRDATARLRASPENALDSLYVRGARWEYVGLVNTLGPCLNLRRVVFGPGAEFRNWSQLAEDRLVRYPSEAELFEIAQSGLMGRDPDEPPSFQTRVLALTMRDLDQPGSCARILAEELGL